MDKPQGPWWTRHGADISSATLLDVEADCPVCQQPSGIGGLRIVFPSQRTTSRMLGYLWPCEHWLETGNLVFGVPAKVAAGFDGQYPVRIRNDHTGLIDIIPLPVAD